MDAGLSLESSFADSHDLSAGKVRLLHSGINLPRPTNSFSHLFLFIFLFLYVYIYTHTYLKIRSKSFQKGQKQN